LERNGKKNLSRCRTSRRNIQRLPFLPVSSSSTRPARAPPCSRRRVLLLPISSPLSSALRCHSKSPSPNPSAPVGSPRWPKDMSHGRRRCPAPAPCRSRWRVSRTWSLAWRRRPSSASTPTLVRGIIFLWFTDLCFRSLPVCADCVSYLPLHAFIFNHRILPVSAIPRNTRARFVCVCFGRSISNSESSQNPRSNMPWWKRMFGCFSGNNTNCTIISCTLHRPGARR
jgi:hypothetical protein